MILKITLDRVLEENNIQAATFCADEITAIGEDFDIVFTSKEMLHLFKNETRPVIVIENFLSKDEIPAKRTCNHKTNHRKKFWCVISN